MKIAKSKSGVTIGALFTVVSFILTWTFIVPIISVLPGMLFESIAERLVDNEPYSNVGKTTILLLAILFLLTLFLSLVWIRNEIVKHGSILTSQINLIMCLLFFIAHSLGFYIYWGVALDFRSDGQLIFGAVISYPISSFSFVFIGILIDLVKNRIMPKSIPSI